MLEVASSPKVAFTWEKFSFFAIDVTRGYIFLMYSVSLKMNVLSGLNPTAIISRMFWWAHSEVCFRVYSWLRMNFSSSVISM
jgi:hypothetical protein